MIFVSPELYTKIIFLKLNEVSGVSFLREIKPKRGAPVFAPARGE